MSVRITDTNWGSAPFEPIDKLGLCYTSNIDIYTVIDKELFFLSIIKYGIQFTNY